MKSTPDVLACCRVLICAFCGERVEGRRFFMLVSSLLHTFLMFRNTYAWMGLSQLDMQSLSNGWWFTNSSNWSALGGRFIWTWWNYRDLRVICLAVTSWHFELAFMPTLKYNAQRTFILLPFQQAWGLHLDHLMPETLFDVKVTIFHGCFL
jgi:hypothetical protein